MGLDLIVEGCPKPGHEQEWRELLSRSFTDVALSEAETARFQEICIPAYERIGAPRVGYDDAANQWILERQNAKAPEEVAAVLKEFEGYYVVRLVECDGVPKYSHGGLYQGADDTSFRGAFLNDCGDVLAKNLLNEAWEHKFPEEAVVYGEALLAAADAPSKPSRGLLSRFRSAKGTDSQAPIADQIDIARAAGPWFIFSGERGHAIRAWF